MSRKITYFNLAAMVFWLAGIAMPANTAMAHDSFSPYVSNNGTIAFPTEFRTNMLHLGSWFVPDGGASGFHDVYTEKANAEYYRSHGKFPDGATLVKELRASSSADYTTGKGVSHSNTTIKQWFVMIKDSNNRFPDNKLWGDGWGWALFKPDDVKKNIATDYKTDCIGCHIPAVKTDLIYVEAYPMLKEF